MEYAGFWLRLLASLIDCLLWYLLVVFLSEIFFLFFTRFDNNFWVQLYVFYALLFLFQLFYFVLFECSRIQATPGKLICGIRITTLDGRRISFAKALSRYFMRILSALFLCIGFIIILFDEKRQGLHDKWTGVLVVKR